MLITRRSQLTGKIHSRDIPCTDDQLADWQSGTLIQHAMPNLSPEEREFIITGILPEEWDKLFLPQKGA